jgi:hypothetical protein
VAVMCAEDRIAAVSCISVVLCAAHSRQQLAGSTLSVFAWLVRVLECYRLPLHVLLSCSFL